MRVERQLLFWLSALVLAAIIVATLKDVLLPFVAAIVIAYFLNPMADALERLGLPRGIAATLMVLLFGAIITLAVILLGPLIVEQVRQFAITLPEEFAKLRETAEAWVVTWLGPNFPKFKVALDKGMDGLSQNWGATATALLTSLLTGGLALVNFVALFLITPVVVFYLLVDWHAMLARIDATLPRDYAPMIRKLAGDINDAVAAFIRGQGTICIILGLFYAAGLSWAGIKYGLIVGLTTGALAFVPVIGWVVGLIMALSLAIVQYGADIIVLAKVIMVLAVGISVDTAVLSPRFVGQKIGLHPVWLIFALFVFSYLLGLVGTLIAVPLAAAASVLIRFAINLYLESPFYRGATTTAPSAAPATMTRGHA